MEMGAGSETELRSDSWKKKCNFSVTPKFQEKMLNCVFQKS